MKWALSSSGGGTVEEDALIVDSARLWFNSEAGHSPYLYTENYVEDSIKRVRSYVLEELAHLVLSNPKEEIKKEDGCSQSTLTFSPIRYNLWACGVALLKILSIAEHFTNATVNSTGLLGSILMAYDGFV
jgi:hypothetical protein